MADSYQKRLQKVIPGGAHTYSRGADQFPQNAPPILQRGQGAYVYDPQGNEFLDYGMALRAVSLGYAEEDINRAAIEQIAMGNNLTRPSLIELEAAELLVDLIDAADMVKFTKNGSTAVSAAVKLARAYTGRDRVARCRDHPFFSYDDWFIGSTEVTRGVPASVIEQTKTFGYNDIASLQALFDEYPRQIACVVLEPCTSEHPAPSPTHPGEHYLHDVQRLCRRYGAVFILDEMITGFRWHLKGAQHYYGVKPDLSTFGKTMANGFSVAAVAGSRDIMQLASIDVAGQERVFLLSSTHGAEMCSLGAFVKTVELMQRYKVVDHLWVYGEKLIDLINTQAAAAGIAPYFQAGGIACSPGYSACDSGGKPCLALRTLFSQEMIRQGVLMPWIALCYRHAQAELDKTAQALERAFRVYKKALEQGSVEGLLQGEAIKPVFRRYN